MSYIQPKTDFKDGDVLYGIDLNASNEVIKAGVDDNFDRIQGLEAGKQDTLTAGTGIEITEDNVINNTQTSAEWGNIQGDITDQTDLQAALDDKVDKVEGKGLSTEDYTSNEKSKLSGIESGAEANIIETVKVDGISLTPDANKAVNIDLSGKIDEPTTEGTNGQVLTTDGNGGRTWTTVQGGGGTGDYTDLTNKPQINNVTLSGNKSLSDLGINIPTKTSDLNNDSNFVADSNYVHTDNNYTSAEKTKLADLENYDDTNILNALSNKVDKVTGKGLSTEDYTTAEKNKLSGIETGAQVNVDEVVVFDESAITSDTKLFIEEDDFAPNMVAIESLPIGAIIEYPTVDSSKLPTGYMFCDGSAISRTTYVELFALIGTSFGSGDGSTTFNLPNLKGKVQVGYDSSQTEFNAIGKTGGEKTHKLTQVELPQGTALTGIISPGQCSLGYWQPTSQSTNVYASILQGQNGLPQGGTAHNNLQPYEVSNFIIKVSETSTLIGQVVNSQSDSQTDAYSCDYVNNKLSDIGDALNDLSENKISQVKMTEGRYIKHIDLAYRNNAWCLKVICMIDGTERTMYINNDAFS